MMRMRLLAGLLAQGYDHVVRLVWSFWHGMRSCPNGVPYYLPRPGGQERTRLE